jgi:hypothetical protein
MRVAPGKAPAPGTLIVVFAAGILAGTAFKSSPPALDEKAYLRAPAFEVPRLTAASLQQVTKTPRSPSPSNTARPVNADHPPVQALPEAETQAWTEAEVVSALKECGRLLEPIAAQLEYSKPIRNGQCGTPVPVVLRRVANVELVPPAVVNCRVAAKVHHWVVEALQPTARRMLNTRISGIVIASAYACRQRIGTANERLSEHSFANALDVSAFVTADGRTIDVLTHWGKTARDQRAQDKAGHDGRLAGGDARPLREVGPTEEAAALDSGSAFLRRTHQEACGIFGTVLGPEANEAHRDHLHLDLAPRRRHAFCE